MSPLNVLVVDDSVTMRKMVIRTLHLSGLPLSQIYEAGNGREGLLLLLKHRIDLALVDINMPEMNGEEMIARIKRNPNLRELPVVVVSTEGSKTRIAALLREGAVGFVHKPFTPEYLSQVIFEVTGGAHERGSGGTTLPSGGADF